MRSAGMNMICNVFGLGAAATPPGLAAMERFEELEEERRKMKTRPQFQKEPQTGKCVRF